MLAAIAVYANTLHGAFVYDDLRQIVRNTLIQEPGALVRALTSDVWAFKGGDGAVSNYWRPSFVAWLAVQYRAFGTASTAGWHAASILLHALATALVFRLSSRLGASRPLAAAVALLFAVHPVHTESVAWISGSPDLLLAVALLGALLLALPPSGAGSTARRIAALGLYALALGAKEVALLFPVVVAAAAASGTQAGTASAPPLSWRRGVRAAAPFALVALAWLGVRQAVLGRFSRPFDGGAGLVDALLTAPAAFAFYLRQLVLPLRIGPSYPLRAVTPAGADLAGFWLPLLLSLGALTAALALARRSAMARVGLALALCLLAPAFHFAAFQPEQLVHDRYLYLPLAGFLLVVLPAAARGLERLRPSRPPGAGAALAFGLAALAALPLAAQTWNYNRAWLSEVALWQRGVASDPTSAFNHLALGAALESAGRLDEARRALDRSLELRPIANAFVARARVAIAQGRFAEAERDLAALFAGDAGAFDAYTLYQAWEALAIGYERQRQYDSAARALRAARAALPLYRAALTEKLSIVLYRDERRPEALAELEAVRAEARTAPLPESRRVLFRLGLLYAELGREAEARAAWREFLDATAGLADPGTRELRAKVETALKGAPR